MNNSDQVVGDSGATNHTQRAFLWDNGSMQDLGSGIAYDINNRGQVVGEQNGHAFIWESGLGIVDLNTLLPADSGWTLTHALAINDVGQIVGQGVFSDGQSGISASAVFPNAAFLLTPSVLPAAASEPGTLALLCMGFVALGAMGWSMGLRRRRGPVG
jgi:probable HAF family extracellular repeat protein